MRDRPQKYVTPSLFGWDGSHVTDPTDRRKILLNIDWRHQKRRNQKLAWSQHSVYLIIKIRTYD